MALVAMAALMAGAISWLAMGTMLSVMAAETFIVMAVGLLAVPRLQDIESLATMFMGFVSLTENVMVVAMAVWMATGSAMSLRTLIRWLQASGVRPVLAG
ncbi:hypothetical protein [Blastomonas sp. SL216]|uniref:hypothetical protein n=1 Tax=Blastomonas sp. SL216 TaxID=2995169 RepID=UPI0023773641|nr:hypothetical protein OU999_09215 [Blastomonas sp. SL216]